MLTDKRSKIILKGIGIGILIVLVVFITMLNYNTKKESFKAGENRNDIPKKIKNIRNELDDKLMVSKYRKSYENSLIELDDVITTSILSEVCENAESISNKPLGSKSLDKIRNLNDLKLFKDSIDIAMKTLDRK